MDFILAVICFRVGVAEPHFVPRLTSYRLLSVCACEGKEQRVVPTGVAAGDNEIEQHRNFSETHFSGVATCRCGQGWETMIGQ